MPTFSASAVLLCTLLLTTSVIGYKFDAYRAVQYKLGGQEMGSRKAMMKGTAKVYNPADVDYDADVKPLHRVLVAQLSSFGAIPDESLEAAIDHFLRSSSLGVLLLTPCPASRASPTEAKALGYLESAVVFNTHDIPIYIACEGSNKVLERLNEGSAENTGFMADDHVLVVPGPESEEVNKMDITTWSSTLRSPDKSADVPTIAIITHYDTLSAFPGFSKGAVSTGSGVALFLELARIFGKLYSASETAPRYHLTFVLAGGGRLNYVGAKQWLHDANIDSLDFALCLENVIGDKLHLHHSKKLKDHASALRLMQNIHKQAKAAGIAVQTVHKALNTSHHEMQWEHGHFSHRSIPAATLSAMPVPTQQLLRGGLLDDTIDPVELKKTVTVMAKALLGFLYDLDDPQDDVFNGSLAVSDAHLNAISSFASRFPRSVPHTLKRGENAVLPSLKGLMQGVFKHVKEDVKTHEERNGYFSRATVQVEMHTSKSQFFCGVITAVIAVYLLGLYAFFSGPSAPFH